VPLKKKINKKPDWSDDHLGRRADAANILQMIDNRAARMAARSEKGAVVLNIDASWGEGKTFLLQRMQSDLEASSRLVASVNAWELDYDDDPFPALIGPVARVLTNAAPLSKTDKNTDSKPAWKKLAKVAGPIGFAALKGAARQGMKLAIGGDAAGTVVEIAQGALQEAADSALDSTESAGLALLADEQVRRNAITDFKTEITEQLKSLPRADNSLPVKLIILVDELDRCRPNYAISMLERIKHLFDIEGVAFIIATDTEQLCASIKGVYGSAFDAQTYLRRFFVLTYRLSKPSMQQLVKETFARLGYDLPMMFGDEPDRAPEIVAGIFAAFNCSTRDAIQHLAHADMAIDGFAKNRVFYPLVLTECICQQRIKCSSKDLDGTTLDKAIVPSMAKFAYTEPSEAFEPYKNKSIDAANYIRDLLSISKFDWNSFDKIRKNSVFLRNIYNQSRNMLFGSTIYVNNSAARIDLEGIVAACGKPVDLTD
jgi:hypothetical protein